MKVLMWPMLHCGNLSCTKQIFIHVSVIHDNISLQKFQDAKYTKLCFNTWHLDEHKLSGVDNICKLIHQKSQHSDINYHMTLIAIFSVHPLWYLVSLTTWTSTMAIATYCRFQNLPTKVKLVVWTLQNTTLNMIYVFDCIQCCCHPILLNTNFQFFDNQCQTQMRRHLLSLFVIGNFFSHRY